MAPTLEELAKNTYRKQTILLAATTRAMVTRHLTPLRSLALRPVTEHAQTNISKIHVTTAATFEATMHGQEHQWLLLLISLCQAIPLKAVMVDAPN
jgi:hypothetical protein